MSLRMCSVGELRDVAKKGDGAVQMTSRVGRPGKKVKEVARRTACRDVVQSDRDGIPVTRTKETRRIFIGKGRRGHKSVGNGNKKARWALCSGQKRSQRPLIPEAQQAAGMMTKLEEPGLFRVSTMVKLFVGYHKSYKCDEIRLIERQKTLNLLE
jgi:hypothetical protein